MTPNEIFFLLFGIILGALALMIVVLLYHDIRC